MVRVRFAHFPELNTFVLPEFDTETLLIESLVLTTVEPLVEMLTVDPASAGDAKAARKTATDATQIVTFLTKLFICSPPLYYTL